ESRTSRTTPPRWEPVLSPSRTSRTYPPTLVSVIGRASGHDLDAAGRGIKARRRPGRRGMRVRFKKRIQPTIAGGWGLAGVAAGRGRAARARPQMDRSRARCGVADESLAADRVNFGWRRREGGKIVEIDIADRAVENE